MIKVIIELWPRGDESRKSVLGEIDICNDGKSKNPRIGNYNARLKKFGGKGTWKSGNVSGFPRKALGPYDLLYRILKNIVGYRNKKGD